MVRWQPAIIEIQFRLQPAVPGYEGTLGRLGIAPDRIRAEKRSQRCDQLGTRVGPAGCREEETWIVGVADYAACCIGSIMQQHPPFVPCGQFRGIGSAEEIREIGGIGASVRRPEP